MPEHKAGESRDDWMKRCVPYLIKNEDKTQEQATGQCGGMYDSWKEKHILFAKFKPPESGDAPEGVQNILESAYSSCRSAWVKDHPNDKENADNKESCAKQAWAAVKNAGWLETKEGWKKSHSDDFEPPQTFEIKDQPVAIIGRWKNFNYTEKNLQDMVDAFNEISKSEEFNVPIKIGHDEDQELLEKSGLPSAGWISKLKVKSGKLLADLSKIPAQVYKIAKGGGYKELSSEIIHNYVHINTGKKYPMVLGAVSLVPAGQHKTMETLDDLVSLYYSDDSINKEIKFNLSMDAESIKEEEQMEELEKAKVRITELEKENIEYKVKTETAEKEKLEATKSLDETKKTLEEVKATSRKTEVDNFINDNPKKILPAQKAIYSSLLMGTDEKKIKFTSEKGKEEEFTSVELVKKLVESMPDLIEFSEKTTDEKMNFSKETETGEPIDNVKEAQMITEYAKEKKIGVREAKDELRKQGKIKEMEV
jgi:cation transport regulator ChaB